MDRQAVVEAIVRRRAGEACEPAAPVENAAMADARGLGQARGARGIDQKRAVVDGDVAALGRRQRIAVELRERGIDILIAPDLRRALEQRPRGREHIGKLARQDDVVGARDIDAMRQRLPHELGVDQRHHAADLADAEPGRDIVGTRRHDQAHGVAAPDSNRQRPARIAIDAFGKRAIAQRLAHRRPAPAGPAGAPPSPPPHRRTAATARPRCARSARSPSARSWRPRVFAAGFRSGDRSGRWSWPLS